MKRNSGAMPLALCLLALQGCASVSVDADGTRHVTGFVRLTLPPPAFEAGADAVRVQGLGLQLIRSPGVGTSVVLGYGDTRLAVIRNDAKVSRRAVADAWPLEEAR